MTYIVELAGTLATDQESKTTRLRVGVPSAGLLEFVQRHPEARIVAYEPVARPPARAA
jgi:hypothetical protein